MKLSTRLTLAMVALVLLTAAAIGALMYRAIVNVALPRGLDRIYTHAQLLATELDAFARAAQTDVLSFRAAGSINAIMRARRAGGVYPSGGLSEATWRARLAARFAGELAVKPAHLEYRLIGVDGNGREIVRIDRSGPNGAIRVVPDADLQPKGMWEAFQQSIGLPPGEVHVSPVGLSKENGIIDVPHVPVLRVSAPVHDADGRPFGIVMINVDMRPIFAHIRSPAHFGGLAYVVNEQGDYLVHPDESREFGFQLGKPARIQDEFPEFAEMLALEGPDPRVLSDTAGSWFGVGAAVVRLAGGPRVVVIESMPYAKVVAAITAVRDAGVVGGSIAVICALALAVVLARSLVRPLVQMTRAVETFRHDQSAAVPTDAAGEIGVLATAFARMGAEVREKTAALEHEIEARSRIFDTSLDLIMVTDSWGTIMRINPSAKTILGYDPDQMAGRNAIAFVYPDDLEAVRAEMRLARRGKLMRNFETRYVHRDGRPVTLAWSGVWSEPEQHHFFIGRDMTEQRLAEEKFRLAVDASPSGLVMIDGDGVIVLINAETERLFGYQRAELIGRPVDILVPEAVRGRHSHHRAAFVALPQTRRLRSGRDLFGVRKDGSEFPVEIGLNPIHTGHGLLILSVIVDISERKRAEAELRAYAAREQLFIAAVESSSDAIVTKTLDGIITGWNPAAERLFGYTAAEAIGRSIDLIVPDERKDEVLTILQEIRRGEKIEHHETVRVAKDGRRFDVSLSVSPVRSASGEIIGAAKIARDVTESKQARQALIDSERMALGIIDTALDAFVQFDDAGTVLDWNRQAEAMFGRSHAEAIGQPFAEFAIPADIRGGFPQRLAHFAQAAEQSVPAQRYETRSLRRDGSEFAVEVSMTALRRGDGHVFNAFVRDLTEKRKIEEQFRQSQKMEAVGQLTGGIAHDFNNMLTVITGTIEILADGVADKPELAAIATLISQAADRGAELTGHLLAFARKQPLQPCETDVNALIADTVKLLRPTLGEHIEIEASLEQAAWPALVDPTQLTSALLNLAVNARDAMPNGGKLTLETKNVALDASYAPADREIEPGNYVMIAMSDTGTGIPAAIRDRVFEPFFSTKDVGKGTGLGLSMVYGFVRQSGGHIKIYSEEGLGTTIRIHLPQAGAREEPSVDAGVGAHAGIESGTETILAVEDDAMVRASVIMQIQSLGYATLSAATAADALALADGGARFDLLFTDVIMPGGMNGRELAKEMAKRRPSLPVLFTSGYTEDAVIHHGRLDPGVLLLGKPYRKAELARMLRVALGRASAPPRAKAG